MSDRALGRAGMVGAVLAAICCAVPLLAVGLPWPALARGWRVRVWWCFP
jgi:mercuric ion transport protein